MGILSKVSVSSTLRRAYKLVEQGRPYDALDMVAEANRRHSSLDVERAFVDILLQTGPASETGEAGNGVASVHPTTSLQTEYGKIPEIPAAELNAEILREAIESSGHLIVRGYFSAEDAASIRDCVDHALNSRVEIHEGKTSADSPWYYPSPYFPGLHEAYSQRNSNKKYHRTGSFKVVDSPRGTFTVLEIYHKYGVKRLVSEFFGEPPLLATRKWVFRHVAPRPPGTPIGGGWHQDGQFMGENARALNMWVALNECGEGTPAPGIELLPKRLDRVVEFGTRGAKLHWVVGGDLVDELSADVGVVSPHFGAGDAVFFDHLSLHRSGLAPGQTQNRYALESWFYARTGHADNESICFY